MSLYYEVQKLLKAIKEYTDYVDRLIEKSYIFDRDKWEMLFRYEVGDGFIILHRKEKKC